MGLLSGEIKALFGEVFGSLYLAGTLTRQTLVDNGKGGGTSTTAEQPCKVQVDACTASMRAQDGYTDDDVRLIVLKAGITGGELDTDCQVTPTEGDHAGITYDIQSHTDDPAGSYWECRGKPAS